MRRVIAGRGLVDNLKQTSSNHMKVRDIIRMIEDSKRLYLVIFEKAKNNYSAYSPDLPGCIATGKTRGEVEKNIREAIQFHIEGLEKDGLLLG